MKPINENAIRTQREVAAIMGITQSEVSSAERSGLRKLFLALKGDAEAEGIDISRGPVALKNQPHTGRKKSRK